jgi:hypothetical protein
MKSKKWDENLAAAYGKPSLPPIKRAFVKTMIFWKKVKIF